MSGICGAARDYGSFALATSLALSLCFSVEREMGGGPHGWTAWFEAAKCVAVLICFMNGLGCFCSLVCLEAEKIKGVESLGLGLGLGLEIEDTCKLGSECARFYPPF